MRGKEAKRGASGGRAGSEGEEQREGGEGVQRGKPLRAGRELRAPASESGCGWGCGCVLPNTGAGATLESVAMRIASVAA